MRRPISLVAAFFLLTLAAFSAQLGGGLVFPGPGSVAAPSWTYSVAVSVDHTKVPNTDQTNFPLAFVGTYTELRTVANGGSVTSSSGFDIIFASDAAGNSKLPFEVVSYSPTTGAIEAHVLVSTLSHTTNTVVYLLFGNAHVTTDQSNKTAVWVNYASVWHFGNGTTLSGTDSTSNGNTATASGAGATATTGVLGGAVTINGSAWMNVGQSITSLHPSVITVEAWAIPSTSAESSEASFVLQDYVSPRSAPWTSYALKANQGGVFRYGFFLATTDGATHSIDSGVGTTAGTRRYVVGTYDGTTARVYVDGALKTSTAVSGAIDYGNGYFRMGANSSGGELFQGAIDESRVSSVVRSADWIATQFNNQNSPSTFYTLSPAL